MTSSTTRSARAPVGPASSGRAAGARLRRRSLLLAAAALGYLGLSACEHPFGSRGSDDASQLAPPFSIQLLYATDVTPEQRGALERAAARWESVIRGKLPPLDVTLAADACGRGSPPIAQEVDDLLVVVAFDSIDGPGGTLGSAGPCVVRDGTLLPAVGRVRIDTYDAERLEQGLLDAVVLHELGHVLGIGSLWRRSGYLRNPSLPSARGADTHFEGPASVSAFDAVGGSGLDVSRVPVENSRGGRGTRDAHWREDVFGNELMTGFLSGGSPLSQVTIASLRDLGYEVNLDAGDRFLLDRPLATFGEGPSLMLHDDVDEGPIHVVAPSGRIVDVLIH